jgi:hypothetical protein
MSSGSKKKEPSYACLSEAKASHLQRMWAEVLSSSPHLLHSGLSDSPIRWRCLLRVLCVAGNMGLLSRVHVQISESRRKHQRCTNIMSERCATRMDSFTLPNAFKQIRIECRIIWKTKTNIFLKALRPGNWRHMLTVMKIFHFFVQVFNNDQTLNTDQ